MGNLSNQIFGVISVAAIVSLISMSIGNTKFKGALKSICALAVLASILSIFSPVIDVISELTVKSDQPEYSFDVSPDNSALINDIGKNLCVYTEDMLSARYGIDPETFSVAVTLNEDDGGNISLKAVTVKFSSEPTVSPTLISDYVTETLMCECIIITNN